MKRWEPLTAPASRRAAAAGAGWLLDRVLGEPVVLAPHPVALFGATQGRATRPGYRPPTSPSPSAGRLALAAGAGVLAGALVRSTTFATYAAIAGRSAVDAARAVEAALTVGGPTRAREELEAIVGDGVPDLDEADIRRTVVAAVAVNTVDAVIAPLCWAAAAGAPGVLAYRAVDTAAGTTAVIDARPPASTSRPSPVATALTWVPARLTVALVVVVRPRSAGAVRRAVAALPRASRSGDALVVAAFAAAIGSPDDPGGPASPTPAPAAPAAPAPAAPAPGDIEAAARLATHVAAAATAALALPRAVSALRRRLVPTTSDGPPEGEARVRIVTS